MHIDWVVVEIIAIKQGGREIGEWTKATGGRKLGPILRPRKTSLLI